MLNLIFKTQSLGISDPSGGKTCPKTHARSLRDLPTAGQARALCQWFWLKNWGLTASQSCFDVSQCDSWTTNNY